MRDTLNRIIEKKEKRFGKYFKYILWVAFASIFILAIVLGPFEKPHGTIVFGLSLSFFAGLVGFEYGHRKKRFVAVQETTFHISPVSGKGKDEIYMTRDITGSTVEYTFTDFMSLLVESLESTMCVKYSKSVARDPADTRWPGYWVFHTSDSFDRPVYVDQGCIIESLFFLNEYITDTNIRKRIVNVFSTASESYCKAWEDNYAGE
jgi:hypothetical protein